MVRHRLSFLPHALTAAALLLSTVSASAVACKAVPANQPPSNDAEKAYFAGDFKTAANEYQKLLAAHPEDPNISERLVWSLIQSGDTDAAASAAKAVLAAHGDSAAAQTAQGEVLFRQGHIDEADKAFSRATQLDPCYPFARIGIARVARASSMFASSRAAIRTAYALDPADPEIRMLWISTLPTADQVSQLKKLLEQSNALGEQQTKRLQARLDRDEERLDDPGQQSCHLVSSVDQTEIPMVPIMRDATHMRNWALDTSVDGKTARLAIDTGASGLLVGRAFAEHAGLKFKQDTKVGGFGDKGPRLAHLAYASSIRIGKLEFQNCVVEVTDSREVLGMDGLIGTDVFHSYLVSIDFPDHKLELSPLPPRPGPDSNPAIMSLSTSADQSSSESVSGSSQSSTNRGPYDAYVAPDMKSFTPVFRFGHLLLIRTSINNGPLALMVLDTGDFAMSISSDAAKGVTHAHVDSVDSFHGLSGRVEKLATGGKIDLRFGHAAATVDDILVMDHSGMSRNIGTEISGFLGYPALRSLVFQIDYRDGLVNFIYDKNKDAFRARGPAPPCGGCVPTGYVHPDQ